MITRQDILQTYGPLGKGPKLNANQRDAVAEALIGMMGELTEAAARILSHHLHRAAMANPNALAIDAVTVAARDLGASEVAGGALLGGSRLGDWLRSTWRRRKEIARKVTNTFKQGREAYERLAPQVLEARDKAKQLAADARAVADAARGEVAALREASKMPARASDAAAEAAEDARTDAEQEGAGRMGGSAMGGAPLGGAFLGGARVARSDYKSMRGNRMSLSDALRQ